VRDSRVLKQRVGRSRFLACAGARRARLGHRMGTSENLKSGFAAQGA
jgi:hypothetical protein